MLKPAGKKQAMALAIVWTVLTICWFTRLFRPNSDWLHISMVIVSAINAGMWWMNYAKKRQEENHHE